MRPLAVALKCLISPGGARVLVGTLALTFLIADGSLVAGEASKRTIGFVTFIEGIWVLAVKGDTVQVVGGQCLPLDGKLWPASDDAKIRIALMNGKPITFTNKDGKESPIDLPDVPENVSLPERFLEALERYFSRSPAQYVPTLARDGLAHRVELMEGVAQLNAEGIDLSSVFRKAPARTYTLLIQERMSDPQAIKWKWVGVTSYEWAPDSPAPLAVANLHAGLFRVILLDDESKEARQVQAWFFAASPDDYPSAASSFARAVQLATWWGDGLEAWEVRGRLRAYLEMLAE